MQERGAEQPRHEGGVLDRVPIPPAAPAEDVIGPPAAHRDAERQPAPGGQGPGPHPARPERADPAFEEGGDRKRIGDREPDIAEIEKGRVKGEAGILQERVQVAAIHRHREEPVERVRGGDDKEQCAKAEEPLDGEGAGAQARRQGAAEAGDEPAEQGEHEHPQHHRAFVAAPYAGDLVEHRLRQARILVDVAHREIGDDVRMDKRRKGERDQAELQECRGPRHIHQRPALGLRAGERHHRLHRRHQERQDQREMTDFYEHVMTLRTPEREWPIEPFCSDFTGNLARPPFPATVSSIAGLRRCGARGRI